MTDARVLVHPSAELLAKAVAARLVTRMLDVQAARGVASIVLTGGRIGTRVQAELRDSPARDAVDWRRVDVWWGDERFVPGDDPERNEVQARKALLDHVPIDPARVHPFPSARDRDGSGADAAAEAYAAELVRVAGAAGHGDVPRFDVLMLGVGEDGHTASIFPGSPAAHGDERPVMAVHGAPKPPPTRLSLTFGALGAATEVWMIASGEDKAPAVAAALGGAARVEVPAGGVRGRAATLWLLDRAAASRLPSS